MHPAVRHAVALLLTLVAPASLEAQQAAIPSPAIARSVPARPDARHVFVLDSAHLLSDGGIRALQDSALALQASTGADVAFVTLPTLHGGSTDEAARTIGRGWGVGSAGAPGDPTRNRGLVILYVPDKTAVSGPNLRVEVGRGLEGAITDGGGSRAILEAMKPPLRVKQYDEGFQAAFITAAALIRHDAAQAALRPVPVRPIEPSDDAWRKPTLIGLVILALLFLLYLLHRYWRDRPTSEDRPVMVFRPADDETTSASPFWFGSSSGTNSDASDGIFGSGGGSSSSTDSSSSSSSSDSSSGGDFGGGGDFSGGGAGDSV